MLDALEGGLLDLVLAIPKVLSLIELEDPSILYRQIGLKLLGKLLPRTLVVLLGSSSNDLFFYFSPIRIHLVRCGSLHESSKKNLSLVRSK